MVKNSGGRGTAYSPSKNIRGLAMKIIINIFLIINIINPSLGWKIGEGWKYKNVEPSDDYLFFTRIISGFLLFLVWVLVE